jgi:hypothetical protein
MDLLKNGRSVTEVYPPGCLTESPALKPWKVPDKGHSMHLGEVLTRAMAQPTESRLKEQQQWSSKWDTLANSVAKTGLANGLRTLAKGSRRSKEPKPHSNTLPTFSDHKYAQATAYQSIITARPHTNVVPDTEEGEYPQPPNVTWKPQHASELFTNPKEVWRKQGQVVKQQMQHVKHRGDPTVANKWPQAKVWEVGLKEYNPKSGIEQGVVWDTWDPHKPVPVTPSSYENPAPTGIRIHAVWSLLTIPSIPWVDRNIRRQLYCGQEDWSKVPPISVVVPDHPGALQYHQALTKDYKKQQANGWIRVGASHLPSVPFRKMPLNVILQEHNGKFRTIWNGSWPKKDKPNHWKSFNHNVDMSEQPVLKYVTVEQNCKNVAVLATTGRAVVAVLQDLTSAYKIWGRNVADIWKQGLIGEDGAGLSQRKEFGAANSPMTFQRGGANLIVFLTNATLKVIEHQLDNQLPNDLAVWKEARKKLFPTDAEFQSRLWGLLGYLDDFSLQVVDDYLESVRCHRATLYRRVLLDVITAVGHTANEKEQIGEQYVLLGSECNNRTQSVWLPKVKADRIEAAAVSLLGCTVVQIGQGNVTGRWVPKDKLHKSLHKLMNVALIKPKMRPPLGRLWRLHKVDFKTNNSKHMSLSMLLDYAFCVVEAKQGASIPFLSAPPLPYHVGESATAQLSDASRPSVMDEHPMPSHWEFGGGGAYWFTLESIDTMYYFVVAWSRKEAKDYDVMVLELWTMLVGRKLQSMQGMPAVRLELIDNEPAEVAATKNKTKNKACSALLQWNTASHLGLRCRQIGIDSKDNDWADWLSRGEEGKFLAECKAAHITAIKVPVPPDMRDMSWLPL